MGKEVDPVNLNKCAGWESAESREREDEESYPCNDIKGDYCHKSGVVKRHPIPLVEYITEVQNGHVGNGQTQNQNGRYSPRPAFLQCGEVERPCDAVNGPENY